MPLSRIHYGIGYGYPDGIEYHITQDLAVYDIDTADVLEQLMQHTNALVTMLTGGGQVVHRILLNAYALDFTHDDDAATLRARLIQDCSALTAAVADMIDLSAPSDGVARHAVFTAIRATVPWIRLPTATELHARGNPATA